MLSYAEVNRQRNFIILDYTQSAIDEQFAIWKSLIIAGSVLVGFSVLLGLATLLWYLLCLRDASGYERTERLPREKKSRVRKEERYRDSWDQRRPQ